MCFHSFRTENEQKPSTNNVKVLLRLYSNVQILVTFMGFIISSHTRDRRKSVETTLIIMCRNVLPKPGEV